MKRVFLLLALVCLVGMTSCSKDDKDGTVALTDITVTPPTVSVVVTGVQQITAKAVPENATGVTFSWSSDNTSIATVSNSGLVTGVAAGTTNVKVSSGSVTKTIPVTVSIQEIALVSINVDVESVKKAVDSTIQVTATPYPPNATSVSFVWNSEDPDIATVDNGLITIKGVGTTTVTVTSNGKSKEIAVIGTINGVTVTDAEGNDVGQYLVGNTVQLSATIVPAGTGLVVEWATNDDKVATVSESGLVTMVGSGIASITATVNENGEFIGSYVVTTISPLDNATGYWTFDDETDVGKQTAGTVPLIFPRGAEDYEYVEGPSETNKAIHVVDGGVGAQWNCNITTDTYTFLMDVRVPVQPDRFYYDAIGPSVLKFYPRHWNDDARHQSGVVVSAGYGWISYICDQKKEEHGTEPWVRVVVTIQPDPAEEGYGLFAVYKDGDLAPISPFGTASHRPDEYDPAKLTEGKEVPFAVGSPSAGEEGRLFPFSVASIAIWNRLLSAEEIKSLGGVQR